MTNKREQILVRLQEIARGIEGVVVSGKLLMWYARLRDRRAALAHVIECRRRMAPTVCSVRTKCLCACKMQS
jgi:hypothetical protein